MTKSHRLGRAVVPDCHFSSTLITLQIQAGESTVRSSNFKSLAKRQAGISAIEYLVLGAIVIAAIATAAALFADDIEAAFAALGALL